MSSLSDDVRNKLAQLSTQRSRFVIRSESLPADIALLGLLDELYDAASVAFDLTEADELFAAFPRARTAFEAAQRLVVLATDDDYIKLGTRAWLYYLRKDMEVVELARGTEEAAEWYQSTLRQWQHVWAQHHPDAETILREENALLEAPKSRKPDNFLRKDLGQSVAECYAKLGLASGRSVTVLRELNRGIYGALSRESHARLRLDPAGLRFLDDGTVIVIPKKTDEALREKTLLGCLDTSLAESTAALKYLIDRRARLRAEDLSKQPIRPGFKPDLGLFLIRGGGVSSRFRFPNVPVYKLGIFPDGTVSWSSNIVLEDGEYCATFFASSALMPALARAFGIESRQLEPAQHLQRITPAKLISVNLDCTLGEIQDSAGETFAPLLVKTVTKSPPVS